MSSSEFLFEADNWEEKVYRNQHTAINDWLRSKETTGKTRRTLNEYSRTAKIFFHDEFPDLDPEDVEVRDTEKYLSRLNQRELSQNTKRRYLESLSAFYSWALQRPRYEEITGNPAAVILEEVPKNVPDRPDCATWENAKKIVDAVDDPRNFTLQYLPKQVVEHGKPAKYGKTTYCLTRDSSDSENGKEATRQSFPSTKNYES